MQRGRLYATKFRHMGYQITWLTELSAGSHHIQHAGSFEIQRAGSLFIQRRWISVEPATARILETGVQDCCYIRKL